MCPKKSMVCVKVSRETYGGWVKERLLPAERISGCFEEAAGGGREGRTFEGR